MRFSWLPLAVAWAIGAMAASAATTWVMRWSPIGIRAQEYAEARDRQQRVFRAIDQYRIIHGGAYPKALGDTVAAGLLSIDDYVYLRYNRIVTIEYRQPPACGPENVVILCDNTSVWPNPYGPGPDGRAFTVTDVLGRTWFHETMRVDSDEVFREFDSGSASIGGGGA